MAGSSDANDSNSPGDEQSRAGSARSRATVRASLACVQCRSKHLKCDGGLPACVRCRLEEMDCYYAKSRRGIRDPKRRSILKQEASAVEQRISTPPSPEFSQFDIPVRVTGALPGGWSAAKDTGCRSSSCSSFLTDLYYTYFHDAHSWLPPREHMKKLFQTRPDDMGYLASTIAFTGSVYSGAIDTTPLRERAFTLSCHSLPATVWTVQGLLCMSIAGAGDGYIELSGTWMERAIQMALDLGLQHKSFADAEEDPVLAESYRRTYWGLYFHGSLRAVRDHLGHFMLHSISASADLPCEEWEYQAGEIPEPVSLAQYRHRTGPNKDYSSWAYLTELVDISGELMPILNVGQDALPDAVERADRRVVEWLLQLPNWKKQLVDPDGAVDMILFHAQGVAHSLRVRIQLHFQGAGVQFRLRDLTSTGPLFCFGSSICGGLTGTSRPWFQGSVALQASLSLIALSSFAAPPTKFSPSCIPGLDRVVLPLLDACLFGSVDSPLLREKVMVVVNQLSKAGEFWPIARESAKDIKAVLATSCEVREVSGGLGGWDAMTSLIDDIVPPGMEMDESFHFSLPRTAGEMQTWAMERVGLGGLLGDAELPIATMAEETRESQGF